MMIEWVVYLALPMIGAVIGYFTNLVAIWMLFRPHHEKRILGVRIPFTPGLIPGRRLEMAERLGTAIAKHLINEASLRERLDTPEIRTYIEKSISGRIHSLTTKEWGSINSLVPKALKPELDELIIQIKDLIQHEIGKRLAQPETEQAIANHVKHQLKLWMSQPIGSLASEPFWEALPEKAGTLYESTIHSPQFESSVRQILDQSSTKLVALNKSVASYVPEPLQHALRGHISFLLPLLQEKLDELLQDPTLKKRLKIATYELVDDILSTTFKENSRWDQLKFGLMETFFISVDEIKDKIDDGIETAIPKVSGLIRTPEVEVRIESAMAGVLDSLLAKRVSELLAGEETLQDLKSSTAKLMVDALRSQSSKAYFEEFIGEQMEAHREKSLHSLWGSAANPDEIEPEITRQIVAYLRRPSTHADIGVLVSDEIDKLLDRPIGVLGNRVSDEAVHKVSVWLTETSLDLLKRETPRILSAIDVEGLVREQVNKLPLNEMERLILAITSRQLKAITWFGALLGFSIGLIQLVIIVLTGGLGS